LGDRIGRSAAFTLLLGCYAVLDVACSFAHGHQAADSFLPVFAFLAGGLTGGFNVLTATLPFDVLSRAEADVAMSLVFPFLGIGTLFGPVGAAALHTRTGSYDSVLLGAGALLLLATAMSMCVWLVARGRRAHTVPASTASAESASGSRSHSDVHTSGSRSHSDVHTSGSRSHSDVALVDVAINPVSTRAP
jgi:MFS family permease